MGVTNWSDSNYLSNAALIGTEPFFVAIWCNVAQSATFRGVYGQGVLDTSNYRQVVLFDSNVGVAESYNGTNDGLATSANTHPNSTWFLLAGAFISTTSRSIWVDGGTRADDTTSVTVGAGGVSVIGRTPQSSIPFTAAGGIAEVSVWNATGMTSGNMDSLVSKLKGSGSGGNPLNIKAEVGQPWSDKLVSYWTLNNNTDLNDKFGSNNLTANGTINNFASHPTIDAVTGGSTSLMPQIWM